MESMTNRHKLADFMAEKNLTQSHVARAIGKSPSVINQYLKGNYGGDVLKIEELVRGYLELQNDKEVTPKTTSEFITTHTSKKGLEVVRMAHVDGEINVIYGDAGLGKTMIMKEYARQNKGAILIEADPGYTALALLDDLLAALSIGRRGSVHDMSNMCIDELKDSDRILLIDEAELLPYRALEVLRRIHDKSGVAVVLAGMPKLLVNLRGKRGEYAQLYSRVGFALNLGNTLPVDEINDIAKNYLGEVGQDVCDALYQKSKGNARRLFKLLRGLRRTSKSTSRKSVKTW